MLAPAEFGRLQAAIDAMGARAVVSVEAYQKCHYLPEWYPYCRDITPQTVFFAPGEDVQPILSRLKWPAFFVKDFVKSLTTTRGSVARTIDEVREIAALIEQYRGQLEGGLCVREWIDLLPLTEERYFVLHGRAMARDGMVPPLVHEIARHIDTPFFFRRHRPAA